MSQTKKSISNKLNFSSLKSFRDNFAFTMLTFIVYDRDKLCLASAYQRCLLSFGGTDSHVLQSPHGCWTSTCGCSGHADASQSHMLSSHDPQVSRAFSIRWWHWWRVRFFLLVIKNRAISYRQLSGSVLCLPMIKALPATMAIEW